MVRQIIQWEYKMYKKGTQSHRNASRDSGGKIGVMQVVWGIWMVWDLV